MLKETDCWEDENHPRPEPSPFDQVLVLGWYDGPQEGFIRCARCKRVYHFNYLDAVDEDEGIRLFALAPLPADSIERMTKALSSYMEPGWPMWVPIWSFPTDEDRQLSDSLVAAIRAKAGPPRLVISTSDMARQIQGAKLVSEQEAGHVNEPFTGRVTNVQIETAFE
jgi:hypothetical protein